MKKNRKILVLMAMVFSILLILGSVGVNSYAYSYDSEYKPETIVLDYTFFDLNYSTDKEKYSEGAKKFVTDSAELIGFLEEGYFSNVDQYVACAKALNYAKTNQYLDQKKYADPFDDYFQNDKNASSLYYEYSCLVKFEEDFKNAFASTLSTNLDAMLSEASNMDKIRLIEAIDENNKVIKICDAILFNLPDYQAVKDMKAKAQSAVDKLVGSVGSSFYSSDVHKKNMGGILYSDSAIKAGKETESQFKTSFTANSNIYAIAYLPMGVKTIEPNHLFDGTYTGYETVSAGAKVSIDGEALMSGDISVPVNAQDYAANKGYVTFELLPNPNSTVGYNLDLWYGYVFSRLEPGKHKISIELTLNNTKAATGGFEIDWTGADIAKIKKNMELCTTKASDYRASVRKMPTQFTVKSKSYKDKLLTDAKIKAMFTAKITDCKKILKFVNIGDNSASWLIEKNDLGIPEAKYSTMETWIMYTGKDGWDYFAAVKVKCDYAGGGTYSSPQIIGTVQPEKISPKNVK